MDDMIDTALAVMEHPMWDPVRAGLSAARLYLQARTYRLTRGHGEQRSNEANSAGARQSR